MWRDQKGSSYTVTIDGPDTIGVSTIRPKRWHTTVGTSQGESHHFHSHITGRISHMGVGYAWAWDMLFHKTTGAQRVVLGAVVATSKARGVVQNRFRSLSHRSRDQGIKESPRWLQLDLTKQNEKRTAASWAQWARAAHPSSEPNHRPTHRRLIC